METDLIEVDDFFVEKAKNDPKLLEEFWLSALEELKAGNYKACCGSLATYIIASGKISEVADFLNRPEDKLKIQLENMEIDKQAHLSKIIEFLELTRDI